jgi:hypothetical protein
MLAAAITVWTWWIEPCADPRLGCKSEDRDLARWAVEAWSKASGGALTFTPVNDKAKARLRFYWAGPQSGMYGEARPFDFNGERGAEIYLRPTIAQTPDALLRDIILYMTCLHEAGHALGLGHTRDFDDIMYSFQYGGDLDEYFARHRRKIKSRAEIRTLGGYSLADAKRLRSVLRYANAF